MTKAICIPVFGDPQVVEVDTLDDMYAHTEGGYIEVIPLRRGGHYYGDMWVNDEYLYIAPERVNRLATDVAGFLGRPDILFVSPVRGNVLLTGPVDAAGDKTDVTAMLASAVGLVGADAGKRLRVRQWVS